MNSSAAYKLKLATDAAKKGIPLTVNIRGMGGYAISDVRNAKHTVLLTLADNKGFVAVDPDEILSVWVHALPPAFEGSQLHAD